MSWRSQWRSAGIALTVGVAACLTMWVSAAEPSGVVIDGLKEYRGLVGEWRGVGQVKRGSPQGAWQEKASLVWELARISHKFFKHGPLRERKSCVQKEFYTRTEAEPCRQSVRKNR